MGRITVGTGQLIQGFDQAVVGMAVGEKKTVTIAPEEGYGVRNEEMIVDLPKSTKKLDFQLKSMTQVRTFYEFLKRKCVENQIS